MRKVLLLAGAAAVILIAALLLFLDVNQFRGPVQAQLETALGRKVSLGDMHLGLFPLAIRISQVSIADDPAFASTAPFLSAKQIDVRASLLPLLRKEVQVRSLLIDSPAIELVKNAAGTWNFASLGKSSGSGGGSDTAIVLEELRISNGSLALTDHHAKEPRKVYDEIGLALHDYAPGRPFRIEASTEGISLAAAGGPLGTDGILQLTSLEVKLGALAVTGAGEIRTKATPVGLNLHLKASGVPAADLAKLAGADYQLQGSISTEVTVAGTTEKPAVSGWFTASQFQANQKSWKQPIRIPELRVDFTQDELRTKPFAIDAGGLKAKGDIAVRNFAAPNVRFNAEFDELNVDQLPQFSTPSTGKAEGPGMTSKITGAGTVAIAKLTQGSWTLQNVKATCALDRGLIRLDPLTATSFGGQQSGSITIDTRAAQSAYTIHTKMDKVDANQLLTAATSNKSMLYGLLFSEAGLRFAPKPGEDPLRSLNGAVELRLNDGKLAGVNLLNELSSVAKFLGYAQKSDPVTNIVKMTGNLRFQDGVASTDDLRLEFEGGSLGATGTIGLVDRALNLKVTSVLSREFSDKVGGKQIGGFMATALANPKGELVIPALVTGTTDKPKFMPDAAQMAKLKMQSLMPTTGNPGALATGVVGAIQGKKEGVKGILDALTGKPPDSEQKPADQGAGQSLFDMFKRKKKDEKSQP